ncbi:unnamed protein product [Euphydryas editha]|uniref:Uncharacterized protein n=1 Tax=Euphydryas editha TaxID=104508 RepID=A0AAU9VEE2_EUPED|nr:unnamed protein product [Euphydryas editha]
MAQLAMINRGAYRKDQQRDSHRRPKRNASSVDLNQAAFLYDCTINNSSHRFDSIGPMELVCENYGSLTLNQAPDICFPHRFFDAVARLEIPAPDHGMNGAFNRELEREREYDGHELNPIPPVELGRHSSNEIRYCGSSCFFWNTGQVVGMMPRGSLKFSLKIQNTEQPTCNIAKHFAMATVLITSEISPGKMDNGT